MTEEDATEAGELELDGERPGRNEGESLGPKSLGAPSGTVRL